jgi:integrase
LSANRHPNLTGIHQKHGRWYLVRQNRWIALSRVEAGDRALREALALVEAPATPKTVGELLAAYLQQGTGELAPVTVKEYQRIVASRLLHHFGHMPIGAVNASHIAQYLERRKLDGAGYLGNRERAVLSSAYEFGLRRGFCTANPCRGIRRNTERPRQRYVDDKEFLAAFDQAPVAVQDLMAVGFLTGLRLTDLMALRVTDLTADGILVTESKTGKRRLIEWSDRLRYFVERAVKRSGGSYVLTNSRKEAWKLWAVQSAWKRLNPGFRFRDLRPKAASDADHNVLGHRGQMLGVYVRRERLRPVR